MTNRLQLCSASLVLYAYQPFARSQENLPHTLASSLANLVSRDSPVNSATNFRTLSSSLQEAVRLAFAELRQPWLAGGAAGLGGAGGSPGASLAQQLKEENELAEAVAMESQLILLQNARIDE